MRSASATFRRTMSMRRNFVNYADMTLADGTVLHLAPEDFRLGGNTIHDDVVDGDAFCIGTALGKSVTIALDNTNENFSLYDFYGATFFLYVGLLLEDNETVEKIRIGKFTVITPATTGSVITIEAVDNMYLFDVPYSECPTSYPATLQNIIQNICNYCGVVDNTATPSRLRYNTSIEQRPDGDITCRQMISYVCQILCVNAKIDEYGSLRFVWYTDAVPEPYIDGGNFRKVYKPDGSYFTGDALNGGDFTRQYKLDGSYATGDDFDGGLFTDPVAFHDLGFAKSVCVGTDDIVITAVKVKNGDEEVIASADPKFSSSAYYSAGDKVRYKNRRYEFITSHHGVWDDEDVTEIFDYCMVIDDNPLTVGIESEVAQALWYDFFTNFIPFRPFSLSYLQDPTIESGDWVVVSDAKRNTYFTFCTSVTFTTGAYMSISCNAQSPAQQFSTYSSQSAKAIVAEARKTAKAISNYDVAVQRMNELAANAGGNYWQSIEQADGSMISYMSDKPLSVVNGEIRFTQGSHVWKITGSGFFSTTNAGTTESTTTWSAGIDANNNAVMNTISAIGVNADWINTGTLTVGGSSSNTNPKIEVRNAANQIIGEWNKNGIKIYAGTIEGPSITGVDITASEISGTEITGTDITGGTITGTEISGGTIEGGTITGSTIRSATGSTYYELSATSITGYQNGSQVGFFDWWGNAGGYQSLGIGGTALNIWVDHLFIDANEGVTDTVTINGTTLHFRKGLLIDIT